MPAPAHALVKRDKDEVVQKMADFIEFGNRKCKNGSGEREARRERERERERERAGEKDAERKEDIWSLDKEEVICSFILRSLFFTVP